MLRPQHRIIDRQPINEIRQPTPQVIHEIHHGAGPGRVPPHPQTNRHETRVAPLSHQVHVHAGARRRGGHPRPGQVRHRLRHPRHLHRLQTHWQLVHQFEYGIHHFTSRPVAEPIRLGLQIDPVLWSQY